MTAVGRHPRHVYNAAYLPVRGTLEQRWNIPEAMLAGGELVRYSVQGLPESTRDGETERVRKPDEKLLDMPDPFGLSVQCASAPRHWDVSLSAKSVRGQSS